MINGYIILILIEILHQAILFDDFICTEYNCQKNGHRLIDSKCLFCNRLETFFLKLVLDWNGIIKLLLIML